MAIADFTKANPNVKVELISGDHQNKPDIGSQLANQWYDVDKVDLIQGPYATAPILAAMGVAQRYGKVMIQSSMGIPKLQTYDRAFPATPFGPEPDKTYPNVILDAVATFPTPPKSMVVLTSKFPSAQFMALGMKEQRWTLQFDPARPTVIAESDFLDRAVPVAAQNHSRVVLSLFPTKAAAPDPDRTGTSPPSRRPAARRS